MAVDTACSSSLTAIHVACESIRRGECRAAIAGGVNLLLHPIHFARMSSKDLLSADGRCKAFSADANGLVDGEGVAALLLKPLKEALRDGDHIHGVIKYSAINAGGKTAGYIVPNPEAQAEVVAEALRLSKVDPRTISYVEAHGAGTQLGDPIEIRALSQAYARSTPDRHFAAIGSVKTNIGHLESAAGIAGLTKVLLQMRHRMLVPSLYAEKLNPLIDFERSPFYVQRELSPWRGAMRAAVSSFGAGGANAHLIVEAYDLPVHTETETGAPQLIVLSARTADRLRVRAEQLLKSVDAAPLADIARTLQIGREAMRERLAVVVDSAGDLKAMLRGWLDSGSTNMHRGTAALISDSCPEAIRFSGSPSQSVLNGAAKAWANGDPVDWSTLKTSGKRTSLPAYPFAGEKYWLQTEPEIQKQPEIPTHTNGNGNHSNGNGTHTNGNGIHANGNSRLRELLQRVKSGELSPQAAAALQGSANGFKA